MFSRMRPYELYFWQPTGLKSMRDGYRCYTQPVESYGRELPVPVPVLHATCVRMRSASWSEIAGTRAGPRLRRWRQR